MFHATVWIKRQRVVWYPKLLNHVSPHEYQFLAGESECEDVLWSWLWSFILVFKSSSGSVWSAANVFQFCCQSKRVASWITEQLLSLIIIRTCDRGVGLDPSPGSWATLLCPPGGATTTENTAQSVSVSEMWACQMFSCHRNTNRQTSGPRTACLVLWLQFNWPVYTHKPQIWHLLPNCTLTPQWMNQKKRLWTKDTKDTVMIPLRTVRSNINHQNQLWHHLNSVDNL